MIDGVGFLGVVRRPLESPPAVASCRAVSCADILRKMRKVPYQRSLHDFRPHSATNVTNFSSPVHYSHGLRDGELPLQIRYVQVKNLSLCNTICSTIYEGFFRLSVSCRYTFAYTQWLKCYATRRYPTSIFQFISPKLARITYISYNRKHFVYFTCKGPLH